MPCAAIIVAAGQSRRMGFDKLAAPLGGSSVLRRTVDAFMSASMIDHVVVVCPEDRFDQLLFGIFPKPIRRVDGGNERQDSVMAGLAVLDDADLVVAIHDGARPMVRPESIDICIEAARKFGSAALARPVTETIKKADHEGFCRQGIDRNMLWYTETPQAFRTSVLRRAYDNIRQRKLSVTDEVSVVEAMGIATKLIPSPSPNPKITQAADLELVEALLR